jgi:6-pyruvoyl-tetrahydropterin synthase
MDGSATSWLVRPFFLPWRATVRQITVSATFASTHRDENEGPHLHGHTYRVTATELGNDAGVKYELLPDLKAVLSELHLHSLDDMLVGGSQTLDGIGAWVMERLLNRHPRLVRVDVHTADQPDVSVSVMREIR